MSPKKSDATIATAAGRVDIVGLGIARFPQVNLLPAEIRAGRVLGRVKTVLVAVLVTVVLLAVAGFVGSVFIERSAANDLAAKQSEVQALVAEQAKYAEVPLVKSQVTSAKGARKLAMSTEVLWKGYLTAIQAVTPTDVTIKSLATEMPTPLVPLSTSSNLLQAPSVGSISFVGQARTLPDLSAWMEAINGVPGFADATFVTSTRTDAGGVTYYEIATTVQVNETAFASRFVAEASK
jgi:Tfp pilus assembly protein PilN